jgi:hypothetical protein
MFAERLRMSQSVKEEEMFKPLIPNWKSNLKNQKQDEMQESHPALSDV